MKSLLRQGKNLKSKRITTIMSLLMVAVMFLTFSGTALATGGPNEDCPEGTVLIAKFEWKSNRYDFEKPDGNEDIVDIDGDEDDGTWDSTQFITHVIIKGGQETHTYTYLPNGAKSGSFDKDDIDDKDISNIQFCGPQPPKPGKIRVFKFYDEDKDQKWDNDEDELENWDFTVTGTNYEEEDDTNNDGEAKFDNVPPGTYEVCETLQTGWANTTPDCQTVTVESDKTKTLYFGNIKPLDPEFLCWVPKGTGYRGYFGYVNESSISLTVPVSFGSSTQNRLSPSSFNGVQTTVFAPGSHLSFTNPAFYVDFTSSTTVEWKLMGREAETSKHDSKRCKFEITAKKIWEGGDAPGAINGLITIGNATCKWTGSALTCTPSSISVDAVLDNQGNPTASYSVDENTGLLPTGWSLKSGEGNFSIPNEHLACVGKSCTHTVVNKYTPPSSITIKKVTTPESSAEFGFKDYNGQSFPVQAGGFKLFAPLTPGQYTFSEETMPTGWKFDDIVCENVSYQENGQSVTVDLPAGVNATCMFYNSNPESSIKVTKTASDPTSLPEPGGAFNYTVKVENTSSNNSVTITSLVDDKFGDLDGAGTCTVPQNLGIGGSYECAFTGAVNQSILPGGADYVHTNVVTASGTDDESNPVTDKDDATVKVTNVKSAITVTKEATPLELPEPGGDFTFNVTVVNNSLTDVVTIDSLVDNPGNIDLNGVGSCAVPFDLQPAGQAGDTYTCAFTLTLNGDPGDEFTDTVTAKGTDDDDQAVEDSDDATVKITDVASAITVTKEATPLELPEPGGDFTFNVTVVNNSLTDVVTINTLVDNPGNIDLNGVGSCAVPFDLQPAGQAGDTYTCSFTLTLNGDPGDEFTDTVTASGVDDDETPVEDSDDATVKITNVASAITVIKTADPLELPEPGGDFTFTVTVINNSTVDTVTIESLEDDQFGDLNGVGDCVVPFDLAPASEAGDTFVCTFTKTINGVSGYTHTNTVTAKGTDDEGEAVENSDDATVKIIDPLKGTIKVKKVVEGTDKIETFEFTTSFAGTIYVDAGTQNVYHEDPGQGFSVAEVLSLPEYYSHKSTTCVSNVNGVVNPDGFSLASEETVTCTTVNLYEPPFCEGLRKDLTGRIEIVGLDALGYVKNNTDRDCNYQVGIASYLKFNENIGQQILWDWTNPPSILIPANTEILAVQTTIPECATQVDLFYGTVITDFSTGERYGKRLLAYLHLPGTGYCVPREQQPPQDTDGDGTIDRQDTDDDNDGLSDAEERQLGTDLKSPDSDSDKLTDFEEVRIHQTNPLQKDTDGDGLNDNKDAEPTVFNDLDGDGIGDGDDDQDNRDSDGDGIENWDDPNPDTFDDADCDTIGDGDDDTFDDLDGDGIGDGCDDQDNRDNDGDGIENWQDGEPDTFNDLDGDGIGDGNDDQDNRDNDGDGLENWQDAEPDVFNDADGDGVGDGDDICAAGDDNVDEDGNGTPDACETPDGGGEEETTPVIEGGRRQPDFGKDVFKIGKERE